MFRADTFAEVTDLSQETQAHPAGDRRQRERRRHQRRQRDSAVATERRRRGERRRQDRRTGEERRRRGTRGHRLVERRLTPLPYSREEAEILRERVATHGRADTCPLCEGSFVIGPPITRMGRTVREYRCRDCQRAMMLTEPETDG